jgi:alanine racemase
MNAISINDITLASGGALHANGPRNSVISSVMFDSRSPFASSHTLFVALRSKRNDGHHYLEELVEAGVCNFLVEYIPEQLRQSNVNFICVENTLRALQKIAQWKRSQSKAQVIAITGSNGKTIVKEWLNDLIKQDFTICRSPKSFNSQLGVALSVMNLDPEHQLGIFEAGISMPGEMHALEQMIQPDEGIFTMIGQAHAENFTSLKEKITEKLKLFHNCKTLIYCRDHSAINEQVYALFKGKRFTWGRHPEADVRLIHEAQGIVQLEFSNASICFKLPYTDAASKENILHVIAWMLLHGYTQDIIQARLEKLQPPEMRLQMLQGINDCLILNDSWAADPDSMRIALQALAQTSGVLKRTVILSDMLETGIPEQQLYAQIGMELNNAGISKIIGIGHSVSRLFDSFNGEKHFFGSTQDLLNALPSLDLNKEAILLKGARIFAFEHIAAALQLKSHETVLEINLNHLIHNLNYYKTLLPQDVKWMAMVKAFSYGAGTSEIAAILQSNRIDYLAVAYADEGVALRKAGIRVPVMVMSPETESWSSMLEYNLEPEIYSFKTLHAFIDLLDRRQSNEKRVYRIHIKLDTGMHRLGFEPHDIDQLASILNKRSDIELASVFSHLAASSEAEHDEFTRKQIASFTEMCQLLQELTGKHFLRHILNSGGILRHASAHMEMVRLGIGLYGISEGDSQNQLLPVGQLKTVISQIRSVNSGDSIGYSRKGMVARNSLIATLPIGYADGLSRKLGNGKFAFIIRGQNAPTVGNICMDMCMVDVTDIKNVQEGDAVIVFENSEQIKKLADAAETIPYEILTGLSPRIKRVYLHE